MSELKARTARSIADEEEMLELWADCPIEQTQVYLKSEADKVIADKDHEIEKLKESISNLLKMKTEQVMDEVMEKALIYGKGFVSVEQAMKLVAEIRHHKYKRCLAMAKWCEMSARENDTRMCLPDKWKFTKHEEYLYFVGYYHKWHKRWLKLAEKFKEAK